jgi:hypothetical protein
LINNWSSRANVQNEYWIGMDIPKALPEDFFTPTEVSLDDVKKRRGSASGGNKRKSDG